MVGSAFLSSNRSTDFCMRLDCGFEMTSVIKDRMTFDFSSPEKGTMHMMAPKACSSLIFGFCLLDNFILVQIQQNQEPTFLLIS